MRNFKVIMAFCGTAYHGYQIQDNAYTIQEEVEKRASVICNEKITISGCSRTDSGVHAKHYCFSMLTNSNIPVKNFVRAMNTKLPKDISILSCEEVELDFHARFSCKAKEYVYRIHNSESKNPFEEHLSYHYRRPMNIQLMNEAAKHFIGTHDFGSFCSNYKEINNSVRTIYDFSIENNGDCVEILVKGDGFLYNMIRILVGTLLAVNENKIKIEDLDKIMQAKDRTLAGKTAQAHGLYLNNVYYD
jgi:tRNA pseudouridine38-40 synthase